jgi:hypothetical protein
MLSKMIKTKVKIIMDREISKQEKIQKYIKKQIKI